jgi:hypothetical protein
VAATAAREPRGLRDGRLGSREKEGGAAPVAVTATGAPGDGIKAAAVGAS